MKRFALNLSCHRALLVSFFAAIALPAATAGGRLENTNAPGARKSRLRVATMLGRPGRGRLGKLSHVLRPMIIGVFAVTLRKFIMSALRRKASLFSKPNSPRLPMAATIRMPMGSLLSGKVDDGTGDPVLTLNAA